jgi:hypothetical protein
VLAGGGGIHGGGRVLWRPSVARGGPEAQGEGEVVKTPINLKKRWREAARVELTRIGGGGSNSMNSSEGK